ncbi:MAG: beta-N-acetylhexosaminidase [Hyphomicrobiaceae bacterium]
MAAQSAFITGLSGARLTDDECRFLSDARPAGIILFKRNCESPQQVAALVEAARDAACDDMLVLIDQEGGRVQRLGPPHWRALPSAAAFAGLHAVDPARARDAAWKVAWLTARDLTRLRITMNCAPVADLPVPGAHDIIGNRAYGTDVATVTSLARAVAEGLMAGGAVPVMKHIPGHGRAGADSHLALPVVATDRATLSATDFACFRALADLPAAMTAHVVFSDIDADQPASTSEIVIRDVIRTDIGFDGLLMSDDLSMKALAGPMRARAEAVIRAGSDLALHCNGDLSEMHDVAAGAPPLAGRSAQRFAACLAITRRYNPYDGRKAEAALASMLAAGA